MIPFSLSLGFSKSSGPAEADGGGGINFGDNNQGFSSQQILLMVGAAVLLLVLVKKL